MDQRLPLVYELYLTARRIFTFGLQTHPLYYHAFLRRQLGPRYLSLPNILLCTLAILTVAPLARIYFPVLTYAPLQILPFVHLPSYAFFEHGRVSFGAADLLPFWLFGIAFLIVAMRGHFQGQKLIRQKRELHSHSHGAPRFFKDTSAARILKEPVLLFALGAAYAYGALRSGLFSPDFGAFLIAGAFDQAVTSALFTRYWSNEIQDQLDAEIGAASLQRMHDEAAPKGARFPRLPDARDDAPATFRRAPPKVRS